MQRAPRMIIVLAVTAAAGCGGSPPDPVPPTPTTTAPTATPAPGAITLPPRPRDIPIDDVDPCTLLTAPQRAALKLETPGTNFDSGTALLGATSDCTFTGGDPTVISVGLALAPDTGIERYTRGDLRTDVSPLTVEGFPAVLADPRTFTDFCTVAVDIAPGQLIDVQFGGDALDSTPKDELCRHAEQAATFVMQTLLAR